MYWSSKFRTLCAVLFFVVAVSLTGCESSTPPPAQPTTPAPTSTPTPETKPAQPETKAPETPAKDAAPDAKPVPGKKQIATLETNKGTIKFELLESDAPKACENFRLLANRGYYNGIIFHRVINGFMIQGGDPNGTGTGGQSAWGGEFADEINPSSEVYKTGYAPGIVAMANRGPNTNGSQFFIMHKKYPLPPNYTIFGRVIEGQSVVDAIATTQTGPGDRPVTPITIKKAKVE
ncbi:MAG: peptidylprolyl isomerase [Blastocatellia bacterium]|nr:peptidylprolyl isomerase [Blastocatellia bacterium]